MPSEAKKTEQLGRKEISTRNKVTTLSEDDTAVTTRPGKQTGTKKKQEERRQQFNADRVAWFLGYMRDELPLIRDIHIFPKHRTPLSQEKQNKLACLIQAGIAGKALLAEHDNTIHIQETIVRDLPTLRELLAAEGMIYDEMDDADIRKARGIVTESESARRIFVEKNMGLVASEVSKTKRKKNIIHIDPEDLIEEGHVGLLKAIDHFNPAFGNKFSTPAYFWINQPIREFLDQKTKAIRMPTHMNSLFKNIAYAEKALREIYADDSQITDEAISEWLIEHGRDVPVEKIKMAKKFRRETLSYDSPLNGNSGDSNQKTIADTLAAPVDIAENVLDAVGAQTSFDQLLALVEDDRKRAILRDWYSGGETLESVILSNVSRKYCLTEERIKQLKKEAEMDLHEQLVSDPRLEAGRWI